jgi:hypothetical protein
MRLNQQITHSGGENDFMVELIDKYLFASDEYTKASTFFQVYKPVIYECELAHSSHRLSDQQRSKAENLFAKILQVSVQKLESV